MRPARARSGGAATRVHAEHPSIHQIECVQYASFLQRNETGRSDFQSRIKVPLNRSATWDGDVGWELARRGSFGRCVPAKQPASRCPANQPARQPASACQPGRHLAARPNEADGGWGETRRPASQRASASHAGASQRAQVRTCPSVRVRDRTPPTNPTHLSRRSGDLAFSHASIAGAGKPQRFPMIWRLRRAFSDEKKRIRHT